MAPSSRYDLVFTLLKSLGKYSKESFFSYLTPGRLASALKPKQLAANPREKNFCAGHYKDLAENGNRAGQVSDTQGRLIWKTVRYSGKVPATPLTQKPLLHDLITWEDKIGLKCWSPFWFFHFSGHGCEPKPPSCNKEKDQRNESGNGAGTQG